MLTPCFFIHVTHPSSCDTSELNFYSLNPSKQVRRFARASGNSLLAVGFKPALCHMHSLHSPQSSNTPRHNSHACSLPLSLLSQRHSHSSHPSTEPLNKRTLHGPHPTPFSHQVASHVQTACYVPVSTPLTGGMCTCTMASLQITSVSGGRGRGRRKAVLRTTASVKGREGGRGNGDVSQITGMP